MERNHIVVHSGNEELQRFIELSLLAATWGIPLHFHVEGPRGTGKTTLIRAAKHKLPTIARVENCLYNCDPTKPHCPTHRNQNELATELTMMPFAEISHSAKTGTIVGSIDLEKLTSVSKPEAALLPGTLPRAHRGIVFVDEINRLADTSPALVDILLDVMGTKPGRIQIEETGLNTVELPVNVAIWAASNPDEEPGPLSDIRRQLADRFDFHLQVSGPEEKQTVCSIIQTSVNTSDVSSSVVASSSENLNNIDVEATVDEFLSDLYLRFRLESIRGLQAARLGARLHAAMKGKTVASYSDVAAVLPAALRHRLPQAQLADVMQILQELTVAGQKKNLNQVTVHAQVDDRAWQRGVPALWRGLWQRLSAVNINNRENSVMTSSAQMQKQADSDEKKNNIGQVQQPETGGPVK